MPRYFFHLYDGSVSFDEEGRVLPDRRSAITVAFADARSMIAREVINNGRIPYHHRIKVTDASGEEVFTLPFSEAVTLSQ